MLDFVPLEQWTPLDKAMTLILVALLAPRTIGYGATRVCEELGRMLALMIKCTTELLSNPLMLYQCIKTRYPVSPFGLLS